MKRGIRQSILQRIAVNCQRAANVHEREEKEREAIRRLNSTQKLDTASKSGDG
jgi:hypothetical protein